MAMQLEEEHFLTNQLQEAKLSQQTKQCDLAAGTGSSPQMRLNNLSISTRKMINHNYAKQNNLNRLTSQDSLWLRS